MWLLIGYGSSLHSDDNIGPLVAEKIREICSEQELEIISATQLTPELAEPISRAQAVIFVDATSGQRAGEIRCINLSDIRSKNEPHSYSLSHQFTPEVLLELAVTLYGRAPAAWICTVGAGDLTLGECLSPAVSDALPKLIDTIKSVRPILS